VVPAGSAVGVDGAPGQAAGQHARESGTDQERARTAPGQPAHLLDQVAGLASAQPVGGVGDPAGGLLGEVRRGTVLVAAVGHLVQLRRQCAQALGRLLLTVAGLFGGLPAGVAEEVPGLTARLLGHLARLLGGSPRDVPAGVDAGLSDLGGLVARHVGRGWAGRRIGGCRRRATARLLTHRAAPVLVGVADRLRTATTRREPG
jgi:hypothetical protein